MFRKQLAILVVLQFLFIGIGDASAGGPNKVESKADEPAIVKDLIAAHNSRNSSRIKDYIKTYYDPALIAAEGGISNAADRWIALFASYGPLEFVMNDERKNSYWLKGTITKSWIGLFLTLDPDKPDKIRSLGIRKGVRPPGLAQTEQLNNERARSELARYFEEMEKHDLFSGAVIVRRGGQIVFSGAYGYADKERKIRNTVDTPLNIASSGKMFTAVAIAQLIEKGKISLDDPISRFIPEYPPHIAKKVTVRHLLTHTSGIELDDIEGFNTATKKAKNTEELLAAQLQFIKQLKNYESFELPDKFDYSNEGYNLLGVIIERVSKLSYDEYLSGHIFRPAGMKNSITDYKGTNRELAKGYVLTVKDNAVSLPDNSAFMPATAYPAGAHYSSVMDVYRLVDALANHKLLGKKMTDMVTSLQVKEASLPNVTYGYGFGFEVIDREGLVSYGHSGGMQGVSTKVEIYPKKGVWIIVLANVDTAGTIATTHIRDLLVHVTK